MKKIDFAILLLIIPVLTISSYFAIYESIFNLNKLKPGPTYGWSVPGREHIIYGILIIEIGSILLLSINKIRNKSMIMNWINNKTKSNQNNLLLLALGIVAIVLGILILVPQILKLIS
jgi:hypothetical protein